MGKPIDITWHRYGRFSVIEMARNAPHTSASAFKPNIAIIGKRTLYGFSGRI